MKPSKELEMPVFSKNLERMDSIQPQNRPPKKKWWILILILCLVLILAGCILYFLLPSRSDTDSSEVASTTSEQKDSDSGIPAGASVNPQNGHSYLVYPDSVSWIDAKTACESLGGHLATISDAQEQAFVEQLAQTCSERTNFWLGGYYDRNRDIWKWVDGTPFTYTNWDSWNNGETEFSQPDNHTGNEWYIRFGKSDQTYETWVEHAGCWNDIANRAGDADDDVLLDSFGFICEWDSTNNN